MSELENGTSKTEKVVKLSFFEKNNRECPLCKAKFYHEMLLTGGSRLIAGSLRDDLRRTYEKSSKFGVVYPLIYVVVVCPECLYAAFPEDFSLVDLSRKKEALGERYNRVKYLEEFFGLNVDFKQNRNLFSGAASYFLALSGYYWHDKKNFPTMKKALSALRLTWVLEDLARENPNENYESLIPFFQYKATLFYGSSIDAMQTGAEQHDKLKSFGPDLDNNFGYEGMLYMEAYLAYEASLFMPDTNVRIEVLNKAKRNIGRIFGSGKSSRAKPSLLLEKIKSLFDKINEEISNLS